MMHIEFPLYLANSKDWYTLTMGRKHVMKTEIVVSFQCEFRAHSTRKEMTDDGKRTITTVVNIPWVLQVDDLWTEASKFFSSFYVFGVYFNSQFSL